MIWVDYYGMYGYCFYETNLVKHVPEYDVMVLRCYVTYRSCISYAIIYFFLFVIRINIEINSSLAKGD